jgi:hypothetical protein
MPAKCQPKPKPRPEAPITPRRFKAPSARDQQAWELAAEGMSERAVADELKICQSTAHRAILRVRAWLGKTLKADRYELVGRGRFRLALAEHEALLRGLLRKTVAEYHRSGETEVVKKTRVKVYPEGRKAGAPEVTETTTDSYEKKNVPRASLAKEVRNISLEIAALYAGYLGAPGGPIRCQDQSDLDELEHWVRAVQDRDAIIKRLRTKLEEREVEKKSKQEAVGRKQEAEVKKSVAESDSKTPQNGAGVTQLASNPNDVITSESKVYDDSNRQSWGVNTDLQKVTQKPCEKGDKNSSPLAPREEPLTRSVRSTLSPQYPPHPRWSEKHYRDAYELLRRIHNFTGVEPHMVSGMPDPVSMTPEEHIRRNLPYQLSIDRERPFDPSEPFEPWRKREVGE